MTKIPEVYKKLLNDDGKPRESTKQVPAIDDAWDALPEETQKVARPKPLRMPTKADVEAARRAREAAKSSKAVGAKPARKQAPVRLEAQEGIELPRGLQDTDIERFIGLNVKVKLVGPAGSIWVVPGEPVDRKDGMEVSIWDMRTLALVSMAFPGSVVEEIINTRDDVEF